MTCKECIHEKVCDALIKSGCPYLDEEIPADVFCMEFRNTADVSEVVRCKDCVWWEARTFGSTIGRCENPRNGLVSEYSEDDDFCSYGERKE